MKRLILGFALGMSAATAMAAEHTVSFSELDVNRDGAITRKEAASFAALEKAFDTADANNNGLLDPAEYLSTEPVGRAPATR
ncbi:MAG: hypothetical protein LJE58_02320 [Thiogranum sp.]|jgi:Ca2+-binding EF-hand superfamily protein|nr:hypothetical protein [Thiogranum sp.]